jgi:hypothetical protein
MFGAYPLSLPNKEAFGELIVQRLSLSQKEKNPR